MEEEENNNNNRSQPISSQSESSDEEGKSEKAEKKKKRQRKIDQIKYFDPFREIIGPDELLEYKGVHNKLGLATSKISNLYGRLKPKATDSISRSIYQADLGGEIRSKSTHK